MCFNTHISEFGICGRTGQRVSDAFTIKELNGKTGSDGPWGNSPLLPADFYDVSVDYLLGRTNNPKTNR